MLYWRNNRVLSGENDFENAVMVDEVCVSYTLKSDDITKQKKVECTPYVSRKEKFDKNGFAFETKTRISVQPVKKGLEFYVETEREDISEFGVYLPFNFMSKKNGGDWTKQFLLNSPYASKNNEKIYCYFSSPKGRALMLVVQSPVDGWKMDYSPYVGGHFFDNFKILANFDRAYHTGSSRKSLRFSLFDVENFNDGLSRCAETLNLPVAYYDQNVSKIGDEVTIRFMGKTDGVYVNETFYPVFGDKILVRLQNAGDNRITPIYQGKEGLDCIVYAYESLPELYKKSMDTVSEIDLRQTDGNLCEHQCWASAMLRYMQKFGGIREYEQKLEKLLDIITETDENKAIQSRTIFNKVQINGLPPYHIYGSRRIQEQFFGVTILLDAFRYFKKEKFLDYAMQALNTLIDNYQNENGGFITSYGGEENDYSTVCCPMIPIVDMANYFLGKNEILSQKYRTSATNLAEFLYRRGLSFPTETEETDEVSEEREDGSISCTALALLYYSENISRNETYVKKAIEILQLHDAWVVKTPIAQMYGSSLRWWETRWEGDKDGPALCMGHAWSIWRAEADYWAYRATNDKTWLKKAQAGFGCNFAKINKKGQSYAIYQADYIVGGGFMEGIDVRYEIVPKYPRQTDSGLSRYVWIRAAETILKDNMG